MTCTLLAFDRSVDVDRFKNWMPSGKCHKLVFNEYAICRKMSGIETFKTSNFRVYNGTVKTWPLGNEQSDWDGPGKESFIQLKPGASHRGRLLTPNRSVGNEFREFAFATNI